MPAISAVFTRLCLNKLTSLVVIVMMKIKQLYAIGILLVVTACAETKLKEGAERVLLINIEPSEKMCEFLGQVSASEGGMIFGEFMSNEKIKEGAYNQLKNSALAMGGNTVYIKRSYNRLKHLTPVRLNQTNLATVYLCAF